MPQRVIVVGAGAAGLMAAGRAAEMGAATVLLEATAQPGNKLGLSGGGRGNVAADVDIGVCLAHYYPSGQFLRNTFSRWGVLELRQFLARIGVPTIVDGQQRVYPASEKAGDLVVALLRHVKEQGVEVLTDWRCSHILTEGARAVGARATDGRSLMGDVVILATGGVTYPETGSRGDGLRMARSLGHTVSQPRPGLTPLLVDDPALAELAGVSLSRVTLTARRQDGSLAQTSGPMVFTHCGISGPAALDLSLRITRELAGGEVGAAMDLRSSLAADIGEHLRRERLVSGGRPLRSVVGDLMSRRLALALLAGCAIDAGKQVAQLTAQELDALVGRASAWPLRISGTGPLRSAMVTVGGVALSEVDPRTMASLRVDGLYLCGELLDSAGDTGGYNLLMAFSTGWAAGDSAARPAEPR